jgi:hypothetical protein
MEAVDRLAGARTGTRVRGIWFYLGEAVASRRGGGGGEKRAEPAARLSRGVCARGRDCGRPVRTACAGRSVAKAVCA